MKASKINDESMKKVLTNRASKRKKGAESMKNNAESKPERKTKIKTVSIPTTIAKAGIKRAAQDRRSFSNYVAMLIEKDAREAVLA
jgi:hypothetical protein